MKEAFGLEDDYAAGEAFDEEALGAEGGAQ